MLVILDRLGTSSNSSGKPFNIGKESPFQSGADIVRKSPLPLDSQVTVLVLHVCVPSNAMWSGKHQGMKANPDVAVL